MAESERKHLPVGVDDLERRALTFRTIGWLLLVFDCIIALFVFVGLRTGSLLWFFWTVIEGAVGAGFVVIGLQREEEAGAVRGHTIEPHLHAGEMPPDEHRRAA